MKNTTRNRWAGYFGVAVATLLTPAGKLISSAVAAGVAVALVATSDAPMIVSTEKAPVPKVETSSAFIEDLANEIASSDLSIPVTGAEVLPMKDNPAGIQLTSMLSSVVISSNGANDPSGGSLLEKSLDSGFVPPPVISGWTEREPEVNCEQVLKKDASERTEEEKFICEEVITQNEAIKREIGQLMAAVILESGKPNGEDEQVVDKKDEDNPVISKKTPHTPGDESEEPKKQPDDQSNALPTRQVSSLTSDGLSTIAAIPEPSTIGLLLLGLFSLGWIYRRNTGA